MSKEFMTVPVKTDVHKALKQKALDDGKKLIEVAHDILADALGVKEESKNVTRR